MTKNDINLTLIADIAKATKRNTDAINTLKDNGITWTHNDLILRDGLEKLSQKNEEIMDTLHTLKNLMNQLREQLVPDLDKMAAHFGEK